MADDIIIYDKTPEDHNKHIEQVLGLLAENGLKISVTKCRFFRTNVEYMGHTIQVTKGRPTIKPQKSKIDAILKLSRPKTRRELKGLIGMVAYLSQYLPKLQIDRKSVV